MPATTPTKQLPLSIRLAMDCLGCLYSVFHLGRLRNVRPERFAALLAVLRVILRHCDLTNDGSVMRRISCGKDTLVLPCSVQSIADESGLHLRRVERCLHDLVVTGLLQSPKQVRKWAGNGRWRVYTVKRSLTAKFWALLGLTGQYLHDVAHQVAHCVDAAGREVVGWCKKSGKYFRRCAAPKLDDLAGDARGDPPRQKTQAEFDAEKLAFIQALERDGDFASAKAIRAMMHC